MKKPFIHILLVWGLLLFVGCDFQSAPLAEESVDRMPAVAGQFYPATKVELNAVLQELFSRAVPSKRLQDVLAIIAPHAGYPYSGEVAASSFNQIDPEKQYDNIFILGPSHRVGFEGAAIYTEGNYVTPLGIVTVNRQLGEELVKKYRFFSNRTDAHLGEHSVEVEVPFLQYRLKKEFKIVPIVVGTGSPELLAEIGRALRPYFTAKNLFVISTDFSHYPAYTDAKVVDQATAESILANSPTRLIQTVQSNARKNIANLATSLCGLSDVLVLLNMTQGDPNIKYTPIQYQNSGDVDSTNRQQVVGYYAITVSLQKAEEKSAFRLTPKDKKDLLRVARVSVGTYVREHKMPAIDASGFSDSLRVESGVFVTLRKKKELRGCLGRFESDVPLYQVVQQMAVASATEDNRFPPVEPGELNQLEIEISVLTPMRRIDSIRDIELGRHGIYIRKGMRSGVFLPQVAIETGWTKEEFLGHCAQDKAGLGWDGWKDADIYVFEALVFGETGGEK